MNKTTLLTGLFLIYWQTLNCQNTIPYLLKKGISAFQLGNWQYNELSGIFMNEVLMTTFPAYEAVVHIYSTTLHDRSKSLTSLCLVTGKREIGGRKQQNCPSNFAV